MIGAVVTAALRQIMSTRVPASEAATAHEQVAAACRAGLDAGGDPVAFTRGLAGAIGDLDELRRWLADGRTDHDVTLDPQLRWLVVQRLSGLGGLDADAIELERRRDGTADGDHGAATALAARPTPQAKAEAWAALTEDAEISNRRFTAVAAGLWSAEKADLGAPYLARYLEAGPRLAARGSAFSQVVGRAFPSFHLDGAQLDQLREALAGDVPSVLRRCWEDALDDRS